MGLSPDPRPASHPVHLLDVDPDLGDGLTGEELDHARQHAVLAAITLQAGSWEPDRLGEVAGVRGKVYGFLVLSGDLTADVSIAGRPCTRLIGPRELLLLDADEPGSIPATWAWAALTWVRLAILDDRLMMVARRWPALLGAILKRAGQTTRYGLQQQAISQLPRVEDRLLALLWSLADRRGVMRTDGVWLTLPVTHETLAQMIGARRPTVSLGLRSLTDHGMLRAHDGGWLLDRSSPAGLSLPSESDRPSSDGTRTRRADDAAQPWRGDARIRYGKSARS